MKIKALLPALLTFAICGMTGCTKNDPASAPADEPVSTTQSSSSDENDSVSICFTDDITVSSIKIDGSDIEITPEINEKVCSLMKDVKLEKNELDLAIMCYIEVEFSNGNLLTVDDNSGNFASFNGDDKSKSGIVTVPHELKDYLLNIANDVESGENAAK